VGHKILIAAYFVLKNKEPYKEPVFNENPKHKEKLINNYIRKLNELGVAV